ncbi:MAG: aminotransferase class III-fold pyridoxal phosphate-dependent enzyme, partial [Candidatus Thiodiazotropha sp. (ex Notomyrtea botanica)]|nr:aminotransferase class III-fold pyridoxal phosphate-dependent enzyme [Candidatus Thiodiazotropha sp. (ex Notomyrtea botanica)]
VGLSVLDVIESANLCDRAAELGARMQAGFEARLNTLEGVVAIRVSGLMIGIELDRPCGELVTQALQNGLLINVTAERVIRLLPPLIISDEICDEIIEKVAALISNFL